MDAGTDICLAGDEPDFTEVLNELDTYPEVVVIDISKPVNRIRSMFQEQVSPEFIVDQAIEACTSRGSFERDVRHFSNRLLKDLNDWDEQVECETMKFRPYGNRAPNVNNFDTVIAVEQATLDLFDKFKEYKLYGRSGFMPYHFDHILSDGSVMLRKCGSAEEFFDRVAYTNA